jgi:serine/threonine-protein kinase RsbW
VLCTIDSPVIAQQTDKDDPLLPVARRLVVPGRYDQLSVIADFVGEAARCAGLDEHAVFHVQVAVDEACSNVIEHAYGGEGQGEIVLAWESRNHDFKVIIHDRGKPFDPDLIPAPKIGTCLDEIKAGGLGLHLMRQVMDEVCFDFDADGNRLTLVKRGVR